MLEQILKKDELAVFRLRKIYEQYGYLPFKMSRFEEYELYVRNKDFLVSDRVITFSNTDGRLLALKPDVTLSIIKNAQDAKGSIQKLYYNENVYRPGKSDQSFQEILQTGLECVGDLGDYEIQEVVLLAVKSLDALGYPFILDLSHMGLIRSVLNRSGLDGEQKSMAMEYLHQKNGHELTALCRSFAPESEKILSALVQFSGAPETVFSVIMPLLRTEEEIQSLRQLQGIYDILKQLGYEKNVRVDFSVGSDMKYYSGVVFKGYLEGIPTGILSGGAYDKLLKKMGKSSHAIGFAIYLDLLELLEENEAFACVDTVLLYDATASAQQLMQVSEVLRKEGSVLAAAALPESVHWRRLMKLVEGEAICIESNG